MSRKRNVFIFLIILILTITTNSFAIDIQIGKIPVVIHTFVFGCDYDSKVNYMINGYSEETFEDFSIHTFYNGDVISFYTYATCNDFGDISLEKDYTGITEYEINLYQVDECGSKIVKPIIENSKTQGHNCGSIIVGNQFEDGYYKLIIKSTSIIHDQKLSLLEYQEQNETNYFFFAVGIENAKLNHHKGRVSKLLLKDKTSQAVIDDLIYNEVLYDIKWGIKPDIVFEPVYNEDELSDVYGIRYYWESTEDDIKTALLSQKVQFEMPSSKNDILHIAYIYKDGCIGEECKYMVYARKSEE